MTARRLAILGTGSDVGKSLLVAGLCRVFARRGLRVAPFKAQNMSNNAAVTADGGEIGRAQALQARAARVPSTVHMNPVLLKPETDCDTQVVVQGRVTGRASAAAYQRLKQDLRPRVLESLDRVSADNDLVLVEGAGCGAERYLRPQDISNMGLAENANMPVILVADESRGGVTAATVGCHRLWTVAERARVAGLVVTKFRGDPAVFAPAAKDIANETGWPLLGLWRWSEHARRLPQEDSLGFEAAESQRGRLVIAVPALPRLANYDDLDPLVQESGVDLRRIPRGQPIPPEADVILLLGSKNTRAALAGLFAEGWDIDLRAHLRRGRHVIGLCAGYQMLGRAVCDPNGIEGPPGDTRGLELLETITTIGPEKSLHAVDALEAASGARVTGYEMHMGQTTGAGLAHPWLTLDGVGHGAVSADGLVAGGYVHGLFAGDDFRRYWLKAMGGRGSGVRYDALVDTALDGLADEIEADVDVDAVLAAARHHR